jgi:ferredoxin-type protein NapH
MKRRLFQIGSLLLSNSYFASVFRSNIYQGWFKGVCIPFMNCYGCPLAMVSCPIGTLQHFVIIKAVPFLLIGFLGIIGLVVGRMTCGWLCPFGFTQEMLYKIKTPKLYPSKVFNYTKYLSLIGLTILVAFFVAEPWFCKLCPVGTLEAGIPIVSWNPSGDIFTQGGAMISRVGLLFDVKLFILFVLVSAAIFIHQPFCRYLCPLGAIYSIFNKVSFFQMKIYREKCGFFHEYRKICPMDLEVHQTPNDKDCIRCLECIKCRSVAFKPFWRR